jgi:hypothetical protein
MNDDFSNLDDAAAFLDELEEEDIMGSAPAAPKKARRKARPKKLFGMTPAQIFVIAVEIFAMVCILGFFFMIVTEKMVLPV